MKYNDFLLDIEKTDYSKSNSRGTFMFEIKYVNFLFLTL